MGPPRELLSCPRLHQAIDYTQKPSLSIAQIDSIKPIPTKQKCTNVVSKANIQHCSLQRHVGEPELPHLDEGFCVYRKKAPPPGEWRLPAANQKSAWKPGGGSQNGKIFIASPIPKKRDEHFSETLFSSLTTPYKGQSACSPGYRLQTREQLAIHTARAWLRYSRVRLASYPFRIQTPTSYTISWTGTGTTSGERWPTLRLWSRMTLTGAWLRPLVRTHPRPIFMRDARSAARASGARACEL